MITTHQNRPARDRILATTMLVAVGAIVAGALGAAAPANAAGTYVGVAYSFESGVSGVASGQPDVESAKNSALESCQNNGGNHCVFYGDAENGCVALAIDGAQEWNTAIGQTIFMAQRSALAQNAGSHIATSGCSGPTPTEAQLPPGRPLPTRMTPVPVAPPATAVNPG
jgi:hypothetical protein